MTQTAIRFTNLSVRISIPPIRLTNPRVRSLLTKVWVTNVRVRSQLGSIRFLDRAEELLLARFVSRTLRFELSSAPARLSLSLVRALLCAGRFSRSRHARVTGFLAPSGGGAGDVGRRTHHAAGSRGGGERDPCPRRPTRASGSRSGQRRVTRGAVESQGRDSVTRSRSRGARGGAEEAREGAMLPGEMPGAGAGAGTGRSENGRRD